MHHIIFTQCMQNYICSNAQTRCKMKSYIGRPFPKKAYQIQILLAIWPNKFSFLNFTLQDALLQQSQLPHSTLQLSALPSQPCSNPPSSVSLDLSTWPPPSDLKSPQCSEPHPVHHSPFLHVCLHSYHKTGS